VTLASSSCPLLGSAEGIGSIVFFLKPLPFAELVLPLNDDAGCHRK
jgi:hypothetical protein